MLLTVLEGRVEAARVVELRAAYAELATKPKPAGLIRSQLIQAVADPGLWRIQTLWENREALDAMRHAGTPAGVLIFRGAGAEPTLSIFDVLSTLE